MSTSYKNTSYPYGPQEYTTDVEPVEYRGYLIYNRIGDVFDVVVRRCCIGQYASLRGAKEFVDRLSDDTPIPTDDLWVHIKEYGRHISATYRNALVLATYSGYRDPRLTDEQVVTAIRSTLSPANASQLIASLGLDEVGR